MSPPGRPKGESLSAQREGSPASPPGRPKGESLSAQREGSPVSRRLLLVGAGHAHLSVLRAFGKAPPPDTQIVLLTPYPRQVYSGMLPGWIAGHYALDDCVIPLAPLLRGTPINVVAAHLVRLDLTARSAFTDRGHRIDFDLVSIDTGPVADLDGLPGLREHTLPIRPIEQFIVRWQQLLAVFAASAQSQAVGGGDLPTVTVVGGGAGGVEIALAVAWRARSSGPALRVQLVTGRPGLLPGFSPRVRAMAQARMRDIDVRLIEDDACEFGLDTVLLAEGGELQSNATLVATGARPAHWPGEAGLALDDDGYIAVDETLRSISHPFVFAAGDCASVVGHWRPKSGVYAVRAGPPLAENLRRVLTDQPPHRYTPQSRALYLLSTGRRHAIASWGGLSAQGDWVWRWKDHIDRKFMRSFGANP
jgi:pyridine nucleotide-disulfide oxidoreductase family protein